MSGARPPAQSGSWFERWHERGLTTACAVAVGGSAVFALFGLSPTWQMPFLFTMVYAILRTLVPLTASRDELAALRAEIAKLHRGFDFVHASCTVFYPDAESFYGALLACLLKPGTRHLDCWYMHRENPDEFSRSTAPFGRYFQKALDWAGDGGSLRRLFYVDSTAEPGGWIARHRERTRHLHRYSVREVTWQTGADPMSMAVVDRRAVFLALTFGDRVQGVMIENKEVATLFASHFDQHWENAHEVPRSPHDGEQDQDPTAS
jgi:hypothetical protein